MSDTLWDEAYDSTATRLLGLARASCILDVGCGSGMWAGTLRRLAKRRVGTVVGVDVDTEALRQASRNLGYGADFITADASHLPFRQSRFDFVTCRRLLINLRQRKRREAIREMIRVARKGGSVVAAEPSLQTNRANHFSTIRGNLRFSKSLEKAVRGTDFTLGPKVPYLFVREGLERVGVWAYLVVNSHLPPKYGELFLSTVVHGGGFVHALSTVRPPPKGRKWKPLLREAERLDREVRRQKDEGSLVSVTAIPMFITRGTKRLS